MSEGRKFPRGAILTCTALLALTIVLAVPFVGMKAITLRSLLHPEQGSSDSFIFWQIRVPRLLASLLAGSGLAMSGMTFQAMFRNPLATPFTLGVASGASLGAAIYVRLGLSFSLLGISGLSCFAFLGAILSIGLVYGLTRVKRSFPTATMLLAGVAVSFLFSSLILFIQYMSGFIHSFRIVRWLMGSLENMGYQSVLEMFPFVVGGGAMVLYLSRELNLLLTGEEMAQSRGVDVKGAKQSLFFATSLMVGGVVATCGPIGFVGMMIPHICRLIIGADHRWLAPTTLLCGGSFLALCDTLSRTLIAPVEIPVGVITALLGAPFFLWLLLRGESEKGLL
ncbi:MAG: iron ABC transporter permease [candidate division NC10 bacterium]|nr:iron ABC transporter permease [candidate division NC10 bacterium]